MQYLQWPGLIAVFTESRYVQMYKYENIQSLYKCNA